MTKTAHTPGPWRVDPRTDRIVADGMSVGKPVVLDVARTFFRVGKQEKDANARLIAAAPELLEALRAIKKIVDDAAERPTGFLVADFQTATYPNSRNAYDSLCAAIAKAEGRSS